MDIYKFVNSEAIREYYRRFHELDALRGFTDMEKAWLIYQGRKVTLNEKFEAWNELIKSDSSEMINVYSLGGCENEMKLKRFLELYIEEQKAEVSEFRINPAQKSFAFDFFLYSIDGEASSLSRVFTDFNCGCDYIRECIENDESISTIHCDKRILDKCKSGKTAYVIMNRELEIKRILSFGACETGAEEIDYKATFDSIKIDLPLPFQRGDKLCIPDINWSVVSGPFVYDILYSDDERHVESEQNSNRAHDLCEQFNIPFRSGPYDAIDGGLDCKYNIMDCEYYKEELHKPHEPIIIFR